MNPPVDDFPTRLTIPSRLATRVTALLVFLVALDLVLAIVAVFFPNLWAAVMHGEDVFVDPHHMLTRLGAVWFSFLVIQSVALFRWRLAPEWLAVVAGARGSEMCADALYWAQSDHLTWFGHLGLLSSPLANIAFGLILLGAYRKIVGRVTLNS